MRELQGAVGYDKDLDFVLMGTGGSFQIVTEGANEKNGQKKKKETSQGSREEQQCMHE
jgi:hypothetical protein